MGYCFAWRPRLLAATAMVEQLKSARAIGEGFAESCECPSGGETCSQRQENIGLAGDADDRHTGRGIAPSSSLPPRSPGLSSLDRRRDRIVLTAALELRKKRLLIGPHEVPDRSDAGDRNQFGKWIDAKLGFQFGHDKRQIERAEAERCAQPFGTGQATNLTDALCQDRADSPVHDGFDLRERRRSQHVMPPSTTRVCPVMKDAWSEVRK